MSWRRKPTEGRETFLPQFKYQFMGGVCNIHGIIRQWLPPPHPPSHEIIVNISQLIEIEASKDPAGIPTGDIKELGN